MLPCFVESKERENDELDLGLQKTYVFFILVGFCLGFSLFFDLGILELRVEKKKPKKMRARHRGRAPTPRLPPPGPSPAWPRSPGPLAAKGPFSRQLSALSWPV